MFSIIIVFLSIVLIGVLTLATVYFVGDQLFGAQDDATAASVMNSGAQIMGAIQFYELDHRGQVPTDIKALVEQDYLDEIPPGGWTFGDDALIATDVGKGVCKSINQYRHSNPKVPSCPSNSTGYTGCCIK